MTLAAMDHCEDIGPEGRKTHRGSDGLEFFQRILKYGEAGGAKSESIIYGKYLSFDLIMHLLIDDGNPKRQNRNNILNPFLGEVGICTGKHKS